MVRMHVQVQARILGPRGVLRFCSHSSSPSIKNVENISATSISTDWN